MGLFTLLHSTDINAGVAKYTKTNGAVLLDVRTVEEYRDGQIEGSINLPLDRITAIENTVKDKNTPLFVHCHSGIRSGQAVSYLKRKGYTKIENIGGIKSYGGKVVRS